MTKDRMKILLARTIHDAIRKFLQTDEGKDTFGEADTRIKDGAVNLYSITNEHGLTILVADIKERRV